MKDPMEFAIATLLGIISLGIAYLTYISQQHQSFKRLHYTSFMTALVLPRFGDEAKAITVRQADYEFISPALCVARIENTGRAPILPSDFNGPLTIRPKGPAIFRCGELTWNRPDILDGSHPDSVKVDVGKGEISINPILLNPHDNITVAFIADSIPDEPELEVRGRIAGVERIIKLPKPVKDATTFELRGRQLIPTTDQVADLVDQDRFSTLISVWPILASPGEMFANQLQVCVNGAAVANAHMLSILVHNPGELVMKNSVPGTIALNIAESKVVKLHFVSICDGEGKPQNSNVARPKKYVNARPKSRLVTIDPPDLGPGWSISAALIVSGDCTNLTVESKKIGRS